jgi:multidrug efflux system membrane fusion protein
VPAEAVQAGQQGQFVYVVKADKGVELRVVTVGRTMEKRIVLEKGVAAGETVVTDGQLLLYPGAHVMPVAADKPESGAKGP